MSTEPKFTSARTAWGSLLYLRHRLIRASRYRVPRIERTETMTLLLMPEVFNGVLLKSGRLFASALDGKMIPAGARVLDVGTGSGIVAIRAAQFGALVTAVDINPEAVRCARINVLLNRLEDRVQVCEGDLFDPVRGEKFDRILFNPPYYRRLPRNAADAAWRSPDAFDRFLDGLDGVLAPGGLCFVLLSSRGDLMPSLEAAGPHLRVTVAARKDVLHEVFTLYRLDREASPVRTEVRSEA